MSTVLSRSDMLETRNFMRWAGVGTQPSQASAAAVMDIIKPLDLQASSMLRRVTEEISRGVLPSQDACKSAQLQLQILYESTRETDVQRGEVNRG